mgnify:CR=1 FL=1
MDDFMPARAGTDLPRDRQAGLAVQIGEAVEHMRAQTPHVHCLTNLVANNLTANVLLAGGATPSMTDARNEVAAFVARADALLVNLGTLDERQKEAMLIAITAANDNKVPWILDPVFAHFSPPRLAFARELLGHGPAIVRGNAYELAAMRSGEAGGKQGDALSDEQTVEYAAATGITIARTGQVDLVSDGARLIRVHNGHPLMARVTGIGCAMTALMAAMRAVEADGLLAAAATLAWAGIAGELAAEQGAGPGMFQPQFIDALSGLGMADLRARILVS